MKIRATYTDDHYGFATEDGQATVEMERIRVDRSGALRAEVTVRWNVRPNDGLLKTADLSLMADRTVNIWAKELQERQPYDWYGLLQAVCVMARDRWRTGDPPIRLADVDTSLRPPWFVQPFIQHGGPTVLAADGGSGKSLFAAAFGLMVCTGHHKYLRFTPPSPTPTLYLDWETDSFGQRDRVAALCRGAQMDIPETLHYRREYAPLAESGQELARHVQRLGVGFVIVDSKGAALGGAPEDAEATLRFFRAVRQLGVPALVIDHITNEAADRGGPKRPFGSRYTRNMARNVWMMEKTVTEQGFAVTVTLTKSNDGPEGLRRAWDVFITRDKDDRYDTVEFRHTDPLAVRTLEARTNADRIEQVLRASGGPMTVADIAARSGVSEPVVRNECRDKPDRFTRVGDGVPLRFTTAYAANLPVPWSE